jgi:2-hydroxycyclohexanecarboxyl-CoA dehydrogenase
MFEAKSGKIVNVASDAGRVGSLGETVYSAAKGGLIAFTKGLAREAARYTVNVNCVCPGPTDTPLYQAVPEKFREAFVRAIPFRALASRRKGRRHCVLCQLAIRLHHRPGAERERRPDHG